MDIATIIGLISAHAVIGSAIVLAGNPGGFVDVASIMIVGGGSITVTLTRFTMGDLFASLATGSKVAFQGDGAPPREMIEKLADLAEISRKNGPLGLEKVEIDDVFLAKGIRYIADGYDVAYIRETLEKDRDNLVERITGGQRAYKAIGDAAPAFGMMGTLVGLVNMLAQMDDPAKIGPSMAVALLTTLYGAFLANAIALPISDKLSVKVLTIELSQTLVIDGVLMIQAGKSPAIVRDMLMTYLPEAQRAELEAAA